MQDNEILAFHVCGYSRGHQILSVCMTEEGYVAHCTKKYSVDDVVEFDEQLTRAQVDSFFQAAEVMGVFDWEPRYVKSPMDGSDWSLVVDTDAHPGFKSRGLSAQPPTFYDFLRLLSDIGL